MGGDEWEFAASSLAKGVGLDRYLARSRSSVLENSPANRFEDEIGEREGREKPHQAPRVFSGSTESL